MFVYNIMFLLWRFCLSACGKAEQLNNVMYELLLLRYPTE